jgi:hypothetical protein
MIMNASTGRRAMMRSIAGTALAFALVLAIVLTGVGIFYIFS